MMLLEINIIVEQMISPHKNLQPMVIGEDINEKLVKAIKNLAKKRG